MHNARLSDPDDPISQAIKDLTKKQRMTIEDRQQKADLEWEGGLYTDGDRVTYPCPNIVKCLSDAATPLRLGKQIKRAVSPLEFTVPLEYNGNEDWHKLTTDPSFRVLLSVGSRGVRKAGRTMRCRPRFMPWALELPLLLHEDVLDRRDFDRVLDLAGRIEGLGDGRGIGYGRFKGTVLP
jgi:hypothetical protein